MIDIDKYLRSTGYWGKYEPKYVLKDGRWSGGADLSQTIRGHRARTILVDDFYVDEDDNPHYWVMPWYDTPDDAKEDFVSFTSGRDTIWDRLNAKPIQEEALMEVLEI